MKTDTYYEDRYYEAAEGRKLADQMVQNSLVWRPIETAPRGVTVLLYVSNAFGHKHVKTGIAYPTNHPDLEIVSIFDDGSALGYLPEKYARYWMPLPPSPNVADEPRH